MMEAPRIEITFTKLADTLVKRSERGVAILILRDGSGETAEYKLYKAARELLADKDRYTAENYRQLQDVFDFAPERLYAVRVGTDAPLSAALELIGRTVKTGWITLVGEPADEAALVQWIKEQRLDYRSYKGVVSSGTPDSKYIVNLANETVTFSDGRGARPGREYLPSLLGILASCNIERGATNYICTNLQAVTEPADQAEALNGGKLVLYNDFDDVRILRGINSLTTLLGEDTGDMRFIDVIEAMDLIADDIRSTFKEQYQGVYKNNLDNQMLFISAVNSYFAALAKNEVLDPQYANKAEIDTNAQRAAWAGVKPEAEFWEDAQVRNTPFKRDVYLTGSIKISQSMENLRLPISLF